MNSRITTAIVSCIITVAVSTLLNALASYFTGGKTYDRPRLARGAAFSRDKEVKLLEIILILLIVAILNGALIFLDSMLLSLIPIGLMRRGVHEHLHGAKLVQRDL